MDILTWLKTNAEWFFSGLGVLLVSGLGLIFMRIFSRKEEKAQSQIVSNKSIGIQAGCNVNMENRKETPK